MRRSSQVVIATVALVGTLTLGACGTTAPTTPAASGTVDANAPESNPAGDIPDNQVYVPYQGDSSAGLFTLTVPEGWAKSGSGDSVTFTDKLNSIHIEVLPAATAPTPDSVQTRIGNLEFFDGFPTAATTRTVYDNLDFLRGVEVFLNFIPMASLEGLRRGMTGMGLTSPNKVVIFDELMDSNPLFLTGNTDTVYAIALFDLAADGQPWSRCHPGAGLAR